MHDFGEPTNQVTVEDFSQPGVIFQIGVPPVRIDVMTEVSGLTFAGAWKNRIPSSYGGLKVFVISRADLISNKLAAARPKDLLNVAILRKMKRRPRSSS